VLLLLHLDRRARRNVSPSCAVSSPEATAASNSAAAAAIAAASPPTATPRSSLRPGEEWSVRASKASISARAIAKNSSSVTSSLSSSSS
jgi:hypothetical protein